MNVCTLISGPMLDALGIETHSGLTLHCGVSIIVTILQIMKWSSNNLKNLFKITKSL